MSSISFVLKIVQRNRYMGIQQIDAVRASQLINSFIQHPALGGNRSCIIGGLIRIADLELESYPHHEQILSVYHYFKSEIECPILCSAFGMPGVAEVIKPLELFSIEGETNDLRVLSFLHRQSGIPQGPVEFMPTYEATAMGNGLLSRFQEKGVKIDAQAHTISNRSDNTLRDIIYQKSLEAEYLRYYYGYNKYATSQLRVILSPVDEKGRNILVLPSGKSATWLEIGRQ